MGSRLRSRHWARLDWNAIYDDVPREQLTNRGEWGVYLMAQLCSRPYARAGDLARWLKVVDGQAVWENGWPALEGLPGRRWRRDPDTQEWTQPLLHGSTVYRLIERAELELAGTEWGRTHGFVSDAPVRLCACGCGAALPPAATRRRRFVDSTHRQRDHRRYT
jgi:hypothetical protein